MPREMATYPAFLPPHWSFPLPTVDLLNPPPPDGVMGACEAPPPFSRKKQNGTNSLFF